jgi:hypothetical protein
VVVAPNEISKIPPSIEFAGATKWERNCRSLQCWGLGVACAVAATAADRGLSFTGTVPLQEEASYLLREVAKSVRQSGGTTYHHVWPVITESFLLC